MAWLRVLTVRTPLAPLNGSLKYWPPRSIHSDISRFSAVLSIVAWFGAVFGGFGWVVRAAPPAISVSPNMISVRRLLRAMPAVFDAPELGLTRAAPRWITGTPSSMRVTGWPFASSSGSPSINSSYDTNRPVPATLARRSSLTGSLWQVVQVFAPRSRVHNGCTCSG